MITRNKILTDYEKLKLLAKNFFEHGNFQKSMKYVSFLADFMYSYNVIFSDDEIENLLIEISKAFPCEKTKLDNHTVLFYDWWGWETRGLTNIYLKALLKNKYRIIFVTQITRKESSTWIKKLFHGTDSEVFYVNNQKLYSNTIKQLQDIYSVYKPATAFLHTTPSDVAGITFFNTIESIRFQINLTDHAYWLGAKCFDYCIEFRNFGYSISLQERNISEDKLLVLPYYPVMIDYSIDSSSDSMFKKIGKFIFSGGSVYKIQGSELYLDFVKDLLVEYKDLSFVFVGNGNFEQVKLFFKSFGLENRVYLFSERKDFIEFFKRCELYLDTYPINGALMTQYAVMNGAIPVSFDFSDKNICSDSDISGLFLDYTDDLKLSFNDVAAAKYEIKKIFEDRSYREGKKKRIESLVIDEPAFVAELGSVIQNHNSKYKCTEKKLDLESFTEVYINAVNENQYKYYKAFAAAKDFDIYKNFTRNTLKGIFNIQTIKFMRGKLICKFHF